VTIGTGTPISPSNAPKGAPAPVAGFTAPEFNNIIRNIDAGLLFEAGGTSRKLTFAQYSPEDWFLYFWYEAKDNFGQHATFEQTKQAREFFTKAFDKAPDFNTSKTLLPKGPLLDVFGETELRRHLELFLRIGFDSVSMGSYNTSGDMGRFKLMVGKTLKAQIFWRAEGRRGFDQLRDKGYTKQAVDETLPPGGTDPSRRQAINCDKPWHPFSDPNISAMLWYRRKSSDNCWYTAVSIASQWQTSVCYPKIGQTPRMQILKGNPTVDEELRKKHKDLIGEVEFDNGRKELRMVSQSKIAMVLVDDVVFDTQAKQSDDGRGGYDEKAVSCIAGRNVVAMVNFWRVHLGPDDEDGVAVMVNKPVCTKVNSMVNLTRIFGDYLSASAFAQQINAAYDSAFLSPQISVRWDPSGWATMPALPAVKRIVLDGKVVFAR